MSFESLREIRNNLFADAEFKFKFFLDFKKLPKLKYLFTTLVVFTCFYLINSYPTSSFSENSNLISDQYFESMVSQRQNVPYEIKKFNKEDYADEQKNQKEEILMNYYQEYISQISQRNLEEFYSKEKEKENLIPSDTKEIENDNKFSLKNKNNYLSQSEKDFDLFVEIDKEIKTNRARNKDKLFEFSMNYFYGNQTYFIINLEDLENLINKKYIQEGQAFLFWDMITNKNSEKMKNSKFNKQTIEIDYEYYLFDIFPLKSFGIIIISALIFLLAYTFQINFNPKDGGCICLFINFFLTLFAIYMMDLLYYWKYYFPSIFCTFIFIISVKYILDFFFDNLGFSLEEYNIFHNFNKTKNFLSFVIKSIIMLIITLFVGIIAFFKYNHFCNYILFYTCFTYWINLVTDYFKTEVNEIFKPFRCFILSLCGISNLLLMHFHDNNYQFNDFISLNKKDSFYFVGDFFTGFCFCFVCDYIEKQLIKNSKTIYKNRFIDLRVAEGISNNDKEKVIYYYTRFSENDFIWLFVIFFCFYINISALGSAKYSLFHFSIFFLKEILLIFCKYHSNEVKHILSNFMFLYFFVTNYVISIKDDAVLFSILGISNHYSRNYLKIFLKFFGILHLILFLIQNNFIEKIDKLDVALKTKSAKKILDLKDKPRQNNNSNSTTNKDINVQQKNQNLENKTNTIKYTTMTNNRRETTFIKSIPAEEIQKPFKLYRICFRVFNTIFSYSLIHLVLYLINEEEFNFFIIMTYYFCYSLFIVKLLTSHNKNIKEYRISFTLSYLLSLRLCGNNSNFIIPFYSSCIYHSILIYKHISRIQRNFFHDLFLCIGVLSTAIYLNSNYLYFIFTFHFFFPLFGKKVNGILKFGFKSYLYQATLMGVLYIIGFRNISIYLIRGYSRFVERTSFDLIKFYQDFIHFEFFDEKEIIIFIIKKFLALSWEN